MNVIPLNLNLMYITTTSSLCVRCEFELKVSVLEESTIFLSANSEMAVSIQLVSSTADSAGSISQEVVAGSAFCRAVHHCHSSSLNRI